MPQNVYEQHRKHTARTGAYAILKNGEHVASITMAYPKDGAGRLYAYVHWIGTQMVRGSAGGYGYDKRTAAIASAARNHTWGDPSAIPSDEYAFWGALLMDDGHEWAAQLRNAGFTIICVC